MQNANRLLAQLGTLCRTGNSEKNVPDDPVAKEIQCLRILDSVVNPKRVRFTNDKGETFSADLVAHAVLSFQSPQNQASYAENEASFQTNFKTSLREFLSNSISYTVCMVPLQNGSSQAQNGLSVSRLAHAWGLNLYPEPEFSHEPILQNLHTKIAEHCIANVMYDGETLVAQGGDLAELAEFTNLTPQQLQDWDAKFISAPNVKTNAGCLTFHSGKTALICLRLNTHYAFFRVKSSGVLAVLNAWFSAECFGETQSFP